MGRGGWFGPPEVFHVTNRSQRQEDWAGIRAEQVPEVVEGRANASGRLPPGAVALLDEMICCRSVRGLHGLRVPGDLFGYRSATRPSRPTSVSAAPRPT